MTEPSAMPNPFENWNRLFANTMNQMPASMQTAVRPGDAMVQGDAWYRLIEHLWRANPYNTTLPFDPAELSRMMQNLWLDALRNPARAWTNYANFAQQYTQLMYQTTMRFWGMSPSNSKPVAEPEKGDKRFAASDWQDNPVFDALKQSYLLTATTLLKNVAQVEGLDPRQQRKLMFYMRQFVDAISPTNYGFTNPQVLHETMQTGGRNLVKGMENLMRDMEAGRIKMTDTEAFTPGRNLALTPGSVVFRNDLIELIQYTPTTEKVYAVPLLFIPPWINKFYILDMQPHNSLIKFLVDSGYSVFVVSWKNPDKSLASLDFEDYMELGPLAAIEAVKEITHSKKVNPVGYCIGGTLLSMTLPYLAEKGDTSLNAATFLVSLQDFSEVGDSAVFLDEPQVGMVEGVMEQQGYLDSRLMGSMFNMLRANDLIWSNVVNNYLLGKDPPAFDLLYWNADGTRMTPKAHSFYLRNTYLKNNLIKPGEVVMKGVPIDLGRITQDVYAVGTIQDHIVPWQSAWRITRLTSGKVKFVLGDSGHIAGVINPPSKGKGYWTNDATANSATEWQEGATRHSGSWWTDWLEWLQTRSGEKVKPPTVGSKKHPPITAAPGTYVLEK